VSEQKQTKSKGRLLSTLQNTLLVMCSVIIGLLLVEAALWILHLPPYPERVYNVLEVDEENGFRFRPNSVSRRSSWEYDTPVEINSIGMRDYGSVGKDSQPFAFLLGDSFAEGHGVNVDQTIAKRLEAKTGKLVANLGIASAGTIDEVNIFRRYMSIFSHKPKYAILLFYVGNDYYDNPRHGKQTVSNGYLVDRGTTIVQDGNWLVWTDDHGKEMRRSKNPQFHPPKGYENKFLDWSKIYNLFAWANTPRNKNCQINNAIPGLLDSSYDFGSSNEWKLTKQALDDFVKLAKDNSVIPVIAIMPAKFQLNPLLLSNAGCNIDKLDAYKSINILENYAKENSLININLAPVFTSLPSEEFDKLYYKIDVHLTPWGNEFTANEIAKILN